MKMTEKNMKQIDTMTCIRCNCPSYFETYCILDAAHGPMQFAVSQLGIGNTKRLAEGFHATSQ